MTTETGTRLSDERLAEELRALGAKPVEAHDIAQWIERRYDDLLFALTSHAEAIAKARGEALEWIEIGPATAPHIEYLFYFPPKQSGQNMLGEMYRYGALSGFFHRQPTHYAKIAPPVLSQPQGKTE